MEDELHRMADRVEIDEEDAEIKIEGLKGKLCLISGTLRVASKRDKYSVEGEIEGKPDSVYWGIFAAGWVLFMIAIFAFWPALLVSIAADVVIIITLSKSVLATGKLPGDKFRDAVKNI